MAAAAAQVGTQKSNHFGHLDGLLHLDEEPVEQEEVFHWLIDSRAFNGTVIFLVVFNAIQIGVEADYPHFEVWPILEHFFTAAFLIEAVIKIVVLGRAYFQQSFNLVDFFLMMMGVLDAWVLSLLLAGADLQSLTVLRLVRIIRIARVFKVARRNKQIMLVVTGIVEAMQSAVWVTCVLVATIYVAAIFCVQTLGGKNMAHFPGYTQDVEEIDQTEVMSEFNPYVRFGTMRNAMMTLFNMAIQAEFSDIMWPLLLRQPVFVPFFLLFTIMVTYGMMNLIVGLVVENVIGNAKKFDDATEEKTAQAKKSAFENITKAMRKIQSHSAAGHLTTEMIAEVDVSGLRLLRKLIKAMGLPGTFTPVDLLELLDENGDGTIDENELNEGAARLVEAMDVNDPFQHMCILQRSINCLKAQVFQQQIHTEQAIQRGFEDLVARLCRTTSEAKTFGEVCNVPPRKEFPSFADAVIRSQDEALKQAQDKLQAAAIFVEMARDTTSQYSAQKPCDPRTTDESVLGKHPLVVRHMAEIQVPWPEDPSNRFTCSTSSQAYVVKSNSQQYIAQEQQLPSVSKAWEGESGCRHVQGSVMTEQKLDASEEPERAVRMSL